MAVFGHRRRASSHSSVRRQHPPPLDPTPSAAAAATQAFARSQPSNGNLSAAAAAAALRSHTSTPTPVGSIPTKRAQRRDSNSTSGSPRPDLQRRGSAGSMTERSFRSPSPGRGSAAHGNVPPVPALPNVEQLDRTPSGHRRAASLEPSVRIKSPPPTKSGGRGVSLDRAPYTPTSPTAARAPKLPKVTEMDREANQRASVNFSRPMSPQNEPTSPIVRPKSTGYFAGPVVSGQRPRQTLEPIKTKKTQELLPAAEISSIQQAVQSAGNAPIKKKKKKRIEGSHIATGTTRLTGTALESMGNQYQSNGVQSGRSDGSSASIRNSMDSSSDGSSPVTHQRPRSWDTRTGLSKQPSVVHERSEQEEQEEKTTSANTGKKVDSSAGKVSLDSPRHAQKPASDRAVHTPSSSVDVGRSNGSSNHVDGAERHLSPGRSAHFSVVPVDATNGIKHQPSGRATSPFKSALKHSPSSSVRTTSPETRFGGSHSRDVSEVGEGLRPKKPARVSFDDSPIVVSGLQSSKFAAPAQQPTEENLDDWKNPRPALPSFGSVRGRKDLEETRNLPRSSRSRSPRLPMSSSQNTLIGAERSNDHLVGGILAQDFANKEKKDVPLPPEVTTVEGTGYASDTESTYSTDAQPAPARSALEQQATTSSTLAEAPESTKQASVPSLALIPPTPAAEDQPELSMPGAFPFDGESEEVPKVELPAEPQTAEPKASTVVTEDKIEPSLTSARGYLQLPTSDDETSDSDTSSIYSDASDEPSDMHGAFASLDAVLDSSPISGPKMTGGSASLDKNDSGDYPDEPPSPTAAHWEETTAYWRGLSERRKQELEGRAMEADITFTNGPDLSLGNSLGKELKTQQTSPEAPKQNKKKKARVQPAAQVLPTSTQSAAQVLSTRAKASQQSAAKPRKSAMKQTMRTSVELDESGPEQTHMRSTMRGDKVMPKTMRGQANPSSLAGSRWSASTPEPSGAPQKRRTSTVTSLARPAAVRAPSSSFSVQSGPRPALQRRGSTDSVSSFKRQRAKPSNPDGKISLRRSMREPSPAAMQPQNPRSSGFSIRSMSPTGSTTGYRMRSSLRGSTDTAPSLRSPEKKKSRMKSPTRLGFGKPSKTKAASPAPAPSKFKSRFGNDSDDDEVPHAAFVSRFVDSDDELDSPSSPAFPTDLAPVRGIPRRAGQEDRDSTDLEEESGDERPTIPAVPSAKDIEAAHARSLANGHTEGSALASGSLRGNPDGLAASKHAPRPDFKEKRRLSFLGMGKKRASSVPSTPTRSAITDSGRPLKLQRRHTPTVMPRVPEDSPASAWPLPSPPTIPAAAAEEDRPNTSDGVAPTRPGVGTRRTTADNISNFGRKVSFGPVEPVYSAKTGKKKKFGRMRKMFGLND